MTHNQWLALILAVAVLLLAFPVLVPLRHPWGHVVAAIAAGLAVVAGVLALVGW